MNCSSQSSCFCGEIIKVYLLFNISTWHRNERCLCLFPPFPWSLSSLLSPSFLPIPISPCASGIESSSVPPSLRFHSFIYSNHLLCVHCFPCSHWLCMAAAVSLPATAVTDKWRHVWAVCMYTNCTFNGKCPSLIAFIWLYRSAHVCSCTFSR